MKICDFTKPELDNLRCNCNFTNDEMIFFNYRSSDKTIYEIAELMDISESTAN
jgi:hypothetical protein